MAVLYCQINAINVCPPSARPNAPGNLRKVTSILHEHGYYVTITMILEILGYPRLRITSHKCGSQGCLDLRDHTFVTAIAEIGWPLFKNNMLHWLI